MIASVAPRSSRHDFEQRLNPSQGRKALLDWALLRLLGVISPLPSPVYRPRKPTQEQFIESIHEGSAQKFAAATTTNPAGQRGERGGLRRLMALHPLLSLFLSHGEREDQPRAAN